MLKSARTQIKSLQKLTGDNELLKEFDPFDGHGFTYHDGMVDCHRFEGAKDKIANAIVMVLMYANLAEDD